MLSQQGNLSKRFRRTITRLSLPFLLALFLSPALGALDIESFYTEHDNEGLTVFRSLLVPVGGRAEAMGSAFTGLSDDICFFEYNPAASSLLAETEAAVFHNSWIADSAVETIGYTSRTKDFGYGAFAKCFYVPFTEYNYFGESVATSYYSESVVTLNMSYNFLRGYAFQGIAAGVSLKGAYRAMPDYTDNETNGVIPGSGLAQSAVALMGDAGLLVRFNVLKLFHSREPNCSVGLAATNFGAAWTGLGKGRDPALDDALSSKVALGVAWRLLPALTLTAEFQQPVNLFSLKDSEHWAAGAGFSVRMGTAFGIQGGLLLKGANPRFSIGAEFKVAFELTMNVNYTYDLTSSLAPLNRISLSLKSRLGDKGRGKLREETEAYYLLGIDYYTQGDLDTAVELWQKALLLDKRFEPAQIALTAAEATRHVEHMMTGIQQLE